ncbi:hypothetical protein TPL01_19060 [Sulfuriferula plumbiphila]|uniref:DUF3330 domain-containing protein n=1 Tax=Sulfuriferula plumbiphila TaxID=171865 RepID=A0A512L8G3_9PROT|nr:DUF3330 domain-containing protein [Sulfuriferula plumbiphila]BBP05020.1 hypothetical protein SFPGR_24420 [Sulfuriferula plumbiphila]GEP30768.1 hypothetical protein TPL01_19060 [Sulfuriferula plumbiphila]
MKIPRNVNPNGGEILPCVEDTECEITSCAVCMVEIPASVARNEEATDYIQHFCGLDCLEIWKREKGQEPPAESAA